jgi:hypothetical protein
MRILFCLLACLLSASGFAQTGYNAFRWKPTATLHTVEPAYRDAGAVYITDQRIVEYAIEKNQLYIYRTVHRIVHINNDKGIESFNKIYLPFGEDNEMVDVRARTILPNGKVVELDRSNIKDLKDEDGEYKIFALEGLVKNCELEYYFTLRKPPAFFGREVLASRVPVQKARFELITPAHLIFETKSFNQLPAGQDTVMGEKRHLVIRDEMMPEMEEEKYAMYEANLKRVEYKLSYNKANSSASRLFTWEELAKKVYSIYYETTDKEKKKVAELVDGAGLKDQGSLQGKIRALESYLKKNYFSRENADGGDADDLVKAIKNKVMSERALRKLYVAAFNAAGIEFQVALAGDRSNFTIDRNFENWSVTDNFLLYFPSTRKYLAPSELEYRYPWVPPTWAGANGLFCITTTIGNFTTAMAEVRTIGMEAYEHSYLDMDVTIHLEREDTLRLDVKQMYGGYAAPNYRAPFVFLPAEEQRQVLKQLIKFGTNSENIVSSSFDNRDMDLSDPYKPFTINASVRSANLVERAGSKLIVKIGEVIGAQTEMYETRPRALPIELGYPHGLTRTIRFIIPEGYQVKNLDDLRFNEVFNDGSANTMGFAVSYTLNGSELGITVKEEYRKLAYPISQYEQFKKVINAAADFNKVALILEKK